MANTKEKLQTLKTLHSQQQALYAEKNEKYDDSFSRTYAEYGPTVAIIRLEDKLKRKKKKKNRKKDEEAPKEAPEKGPLDDLTKKQLMGVIGQLGGTVPKKANREKLTEIINGFPKAKVAVAITSLKAESTEPESQEEEDGGEE